MLNFPFSAALLAGGQSRRMGRDKANVQIGGVALWRRQLEILRRLHPEQLFICGRPEVEYPGSDCEVVTDVVPNAGPLGGLITALQHASSETVVLLAVDMPGMEPSFLEKLLAKSHARKRSVVPYGPCGLEPLAAVYRTDCLASAEECLRAGERSMRSLFEVLQRRQLAEAYPLHPEEVPFFRNVNTPEELAAMNTWMKTGDAAKAQPR